ncbi:MAG: aldehyde dehydrogenase [Microvirga sp.]|jgi:aldehyde dehydrogenase (NAD+)|nr:aldehyde dehydrogenase [Microvirga sp.]
MIQRNYIGGDWLQGSEATPNINPSNTNDIIAEYAQGSEVDAQQAFAAAAAAFPGWSRSSIQLRHDILTKVGNEILARTEELGTLLSREEGKILAEGIGEVTRAGQIFLFFAGECLRMAGDRLASLRPSVEVDITREPVGVVGLITPWNFPIAIPAWKIAPALAFGNCVILKPAELVPGSAHSLAEILSRAGLPAGVFNLVMGSGAVVGNAMLRSKVVDAISFTGSVATGRQIAQACIGSDRMKKFQLEMGGKNPFVVLDDAEVEVAVECALNSAFLSTGQRCTASSRLIVTDGIHDHFVKLLTDRIRGLVVDDALKGGTHIGPVVDRKQLDQDLFYIRTGREEGATLVCGGDPLTRETPGYYLSPALFTDADQTMRVAREEIFGPVATVIRVKNYEAALEAANDTEFGLSAGICTTSLKYASHFKRNAEVGTVTVNLPTAGADYHVPFGGRKGSSYGSREQGRYAQEFYTTVKTAYTFPGA